MTAAIEVPARPSAQRYTGTYTQLLGNVKEAQLLDRRVGFYLTHIVLLLAAFAGLWVGFAFIGDSWVQLALAAGLGIIVTQLLFISHEAAHRQVFASGKANDRTALLLGTGLGGISLSWWTSKHAKHHRSPNKIGSDPDIDPAVVHFYPDGKPRRSALLGYAQDHQGWWFFPLLLLEGLNLHISSVQEMLRPNSAAPRRRGRLGESLLLFARLAIYPAVLFVFLSPGIAGAFLGVQLAVTGVYLGGVFAVSHIGMPLVARDGNLDFFSRQVLTSRNLRGGRVMSYLTGGLSYQIEHHLFPNMARPHLRAASQLVQAHCAEHGVHYTSTPIHRAWGTVVSYLNRVGLSGATLGPCPVASDLRMI